VQVDEHRIAELQRVCGPLDVCRNLAQSANKACQRHGRNNVIETLGAAALQLDTRYVEAFVKYALHRALQMDTAATFAYPVGHFFVDGSGAVQRIGKTIDESRVPLSIPGRNRALDGSTSDSFLIRWAAKSALSSQHGMFQSFRYRI